MTQASIENLLQENAGGVWFAPPGLEAKKAEAVAHLIIDTYFIPNRSFSDFRELVNGPAADPLRDFSEACRTELRTLK